MFELVKLLKKHSLAVQINNDRLARVEPNLNGEQHQGYSSTNSVSSRVSSMKRLAFGGKATSTSRIMKSAAIVDDESSIATDLTPLSLTIDLKSDRSINEGIPETVPEDVPVQNLSGKSIRDNASVPTNTGGTVMDVVGIPMRVIHEFIADRRSENPNASIQFAAADLQ